MNICFFIKHEITWGSSRERIGVYLDYIKERGHTYKIIYCIPNKLSQSWIGGRSGRSLFNSIYSFWRGRILKHLKLIWLTINARKFDVIVIQKLNLLYPFVWLLRSRNRHLIFDFDDLCFWDLESVQNRKIGFLKRINFWRRGIQHPNILRLYSKVIVGNIYLANIAVAMKGQEGVSIIPTAIDCNFYSFRQERALGGSIVIGWAGSGENHLRHLELLVNPFRELTKRYDFTFKLVGAVHSKKIKALFEFLNTKFACIDWVDYVQLPQVIRTFDIGVMPLRDDVESRGKCGFKALQYMAVGIPVVVSPVGVNNEIIQDSISGFLAEDDIDWIKKLSLLIEDKDLRHRLAQKGRETVADFYSLEKAEKSFVNVIERPET